MYRLIFILLVGFFIQSCGAPEQKQSQTAAKTPVKVKEEKMVDDSKGVGKFQSVALTDPLDEAMISKGAEIYDLKCLACHKLTVERVVGPGFEGITDRRRPEWIMNMITNVEEMIEKDPTAISLLEICLTKMPNQNVTEEEARSLLEFMRKNDLDKTGKKDGALTN